MSEINEMKTQQEETEMTTIQDSTLRNRFDSSKTEEIGSGIEQTPSPTEEKEESQQDANDSSNEADTEGEEDAEAVDTPSETDQQVNHIPRKESVEVEGETYYTKTVVQEDEYGRQYVTVEEERYYKQEESWNTPFPVSISISLIMAINMVNIFCALANIYSCN